MKKNLLGIIAGLLIAAGAQATTYTDSHADLFIFSAFTPSHSGSFTLNGYNPTLDTITSAVAEFTFADVLGNESFTVNMGGDNQSVVNLPDWSFTTIPLVSNFSLTDLASDGVVGYTITWTSGAFALTNVTLTAQGAARSVPDAGSTSLLLGLGVIAMIGAKRRFALAA